MPLAILYSRAGSGMIAPLVTVEVHLSNGLAQLNIVGLPETAVKESKDRVRSAIMNSRFDFPARRITVNLAPADLPKEGGRFDLPIALGILAASGQIPKNKLAQFEFSGELALSGDIRPIRGTLPMVMAAASSKRELIVPFDNQMEAALVANSNTRCAKHLLEVCDYLKNQKNLPVCEWHETLKETLQLDWSDVKGQTHAKHALEIAAAGGHSLLMMGPPGTGKTMLANRFRTILPSLSDEQALETASIASISRHGFDVKEWKTVPFRSPHHTSSSAALVGGGRPPKPGEISLAHHGILFLDELPEFQRQVLESLREPLEAGCITVSRAQFQMIFPAKFHLIAAMNPCPCGYAGSPRDECHCSSEQIKRYLHKISGPLLDRIDMQIEVARLSPKELTETQKTSCESSEVVKQRVIKARLIQIKRQGKINHKLSAPELETCCSLQQDSKKLLQQVAEKLNFSARVLHRMIKIARTIADLNQEDIIQKKHISEALQYRRLDRNFS